MKQIGFIKIKWVFATLIAIGEYRTGDEWKKATLNMNEFGRESANIWMKKTCHNGFFNYWRKITIVNNQGEEYCLLLLIGIQAIAWI